MKSTALILGAILAVIALPATQGWSVTFVIDHFTAPPGNQLITQTGVGVAATVVVPAAPGNVLQLDGVMGGVVANVERRFDLGVTTATFGNTSTMNTTVAGTGSVSFSNGSGNDGTGRVTWTGSGNTGLGGVDITLGNPTTAFLQATVLFSDLNLNFQVDITETLAAGGSTANWSANMGSGASFINQSLASFTNAVNVDFTQVDKIVLTLNGPNAQDATIDLLEITSTPHTEVPEPVTMAGLILGLGGLVRYVRRRS